MLRFHDHTLAGHPGIFKTYQLVTQDYWWPQMKKYITQYVKGCAVCQQTKSQTTKPRIPIYPITTNANAFPFETIALDLIVDLPPSQGYDSILTITDHNCMKAAIFIPCCQTVNAEGIAQLYANHVFPHYGAPRKVISDRDTCFMAQFSLELCRALGIERNISMAYHPQTDGQSERTNQWLEQYLQIYSNYQQDDWARWLPLAQFVHNAWLSSTTGKTPFKLIMGHTLTLQGWTGSTNVPTLDQRKEHLQDVREWAQRAIRVVQRMVESTTSRRKGQQKY
jgi:hypothetical protein